MTDPTPDEVTLASYNCHDTLRTAQLALILPGVLRAHRQLTFYEREVATQLPAVLAIQAHGIPFSMPHKTAYRRALRKELATIDEALTRRYLETAHLQQEHLGLVWQFLVWSGVLDMPGWSPDPKKPGAKAKAIRRRPAPFNKGEWERMERRLTINLDSDHQVRRWLFEDLGLKPTKETEGGESSVNQESLGRIIKGLRKKDEQHAWVVKDLMHRSKLSHIDANYLEVECSEGRVYPTIKMIGTETGRFTYSGVPAHSWSDSPVYTCTVNGEPVKVKQLQGCIVAPPGHLLVSCDYRALEARIFAHLTRDKAELDLFERNRLDPDDKQWDIHIRNVCDLMGLTLEQFLQEAPEWQKAARTGVGKGFQFGVKQYGGNPKTVKTKQFCLCHRCEDKVPSMLKLSAQEREVQARRWFSRHPNVTAWRASVSREVRSTHRLTNPFGQVRYFHQPFDPRRSPNELEREAWNYLIQSSATCILRRAMRALHEEGVELFMEWHDSLKATAPVGTEQQVAATMKQVMEAPVPEFGGAIFPVSVEVGPSLGEMREVHLT